VADKPEVKYTEYEPLVQYIDKPLDDLAAGLKIVSDDLLK
jgi:hypothetical protein